MVVATKKQKERIEKICPKYNLKLMLVHGSFATGKEKPDSDLDIAVLGKEPISFDILIGIVGELEEVFSQELDVKDIGNVDALFLYYVMKDSILLYGSPWDYFQLKTFAVRNYWDHKPIFKLEEILVKKYFKYDR